MFKPEGVYVAMLTPFDAGGNVDELSLRRITEFGIQQGVNGLFPNSTVGEFIRLSLEEKIQVMEIVVNQAGGRVPVLPGVADTHVGGSIRMAQEALRLGCEGVVICAPWYLPISQETIERHIEAVVEAVDIPIILYNIPMFTASISYDVVKRLSRIKNVVGIKDSSGSMSDYMHFMDKVRLAGTSDKFNFLVGREETFFPALVAGAKGSVTASAGIIPEIMVEIYQAYLQKDYAKALDLQFSFLGLLRAMSAAPFPIAFKVAMEVRGFSMGTPRVLLSDAEQHTLGLVRSHIEKIMKQLLGNKYKVNVEQLVGAL
ncbi:4-hydroxy-tetrahydrodipicolinate synthase [Peptococcaceae bacterium CEB3]|nr:4-hydroxy-tetrahydrodipicolinate synthase [Peptococcaceae bacterium CEB3]